MTSVREAILLIEGKRADRPSFHVGLTKKGFMVESVPSGSSAIEKLNRFEPKLILVDAASMRTSGRRICQSLHQRLPDIPIVLILEKALEPADHLDADVVLVEPFTLQKLLNRIRPLFPIENNDLLSAGPFKLDTEQRWVLIQNKQISLTPRLVSLLKALMEHPGEVIDRDDLFRRVWETTYIEDTRTLDVHISWLRQALEEDPRHPRYIKTVRGIGYRLDVDELYELPPA